MCDIFSCWCFAAMLSRTCSLLVTLTRVNPAENWMNR